MGVPIEVDSDYLDALNTKLDQVLAELAAMRPAPSLTVSTAEAAKILDRCERTIRNWQAQGNMPKLVSKAGQDFLWNRDAIERMATARSKGGRPRNAA